MKSLLQALRTPAPYEESARLWTDPHIGTQMLAAHLSPNYDAASYRHEKIDKICGFLSVQMRLFTGARLLDAGCGPGLYAQRFAKKGVSVTGIDMSPVAIAYAQEQLAISPRDITYILGDYRQPIGRQEYDAAVLIYEDYGVLPPADRALVLSNLRTALRPGGYLALDVVAMGAWARLEERTEWSAESDEQGGFWRPHPHIVLSKTIKYAEQMAYCDMNVIYDDQITPYYVHQTAFTQDRIVGEMAASGFEVVGLFGDLTGIRMAAKDEQLGIIAVAR